MLAQEQDNFDKNRKLVDEQTLRSEKALDKYKGLKEMSRFCDRLIDVTDLKFTEEEDSYQFKDPKVIDVKGQVSLLSFSLCTSFGQSTRFYQISDFDNQRD